MFNIRRCGDPCEIKSLLMINNVLGEGEILHFFVFFEWYNSDKDDCYYGDDHDE